MKGPFLIILFLLLVLFSCKREEIDWILINNEFKLENNEQVKVVDTEGNLLYLSVFEITDNRCPTEAICIRSGEAIAKVIIEDSRNSQYEAILCIGDCYPAQTDLRSFKFYSKEYFLQLLEIEPYPDNQNQNETKRAVLKLFSD